MKTRMIRCVRPLVLASVAGSALTLTGMAQAQTNYVWSAAANGNWNDTSKWTPTGSPGSLDNAAINVAGPYTVTVPSSTSQSVNNLSIGDASATLFIPDNCNLVLNGATHTNSGLIQISGPGQPGNGTFMRVANAAASLGGTGQLTLRAGGGGDSDSAYLYYSAPANVLTNGASHTINGDGRVYVGLNNAGLVDANQNGLVLRLFDQAKSNSGTMRASNGGVLWINAPLTQTSTGLVLAQNSSVVDLISTSVSGGTFTSSGTGAIVNSNGQTSSINGVTLTTGSLLQINDNSHVNLGASGLVNNGLITIQNIGGAGNGTSLDLAGATASITGTGTITLQATGDFNDSAYMYFGNVANVLTLGSGQTLNGRGRVYVNLINDGVINANQNGQVIQLFNQPKTNAGTMEATGGGQLWIDGIGVTQTGSGQIKGDNGTVVLHSASIFGGPLTAVNGGLILSTNGQTSNLDAVTLTGTLQINDNSRINVTTSLVNNGLITIQNIGGAGNATTLNTSSANIPLTGSGIIHLQANGDFNDSAYLDYASPTNTLTQASTHTIEGNGRIYVSLINNGTVLANEPTVGRQVIDLLNTNKTNNNLMKATGGGQIWIDGVGVTQSPTASIQATAGSMVVLRSGSVSGGTMSSAGTGLILCTNGQTSALDGVTLASGTLLQINDNSRINVTTSLVNNGLITIQNIGGAGNATTLNTSSANIPLTGSGIIHLQANGDFNDSAYLDYASPTNTLTQASTHTIEGNGRIYVSLINNGTVLANEPTSGRHVMDFRNTNKVNNNLMKATGGGQIWVDGIGVSQSATATMQADTGSMIVLTSGSISGGTISSSGTGLILNNNGQTSTIDGVTLASGSLLQLNDNSTLNLSANGLINNGTVTIQTIGGAGNGTRILAPGAAAIGGTGSIRLQATAFANDSAYIWGQGDAAHPLTLGPGQTISGSGRFYGNIVSQGPITPDEPFGTPSPVGRIDMPSGSLTMAGTSSLAIQAASGSSYDQLTGNDAITVAGSLTVSTISGYVPAAHDILTIVSGSSVAGTFSSTNLPPVGSFGPAHVVYTPTAVEVVMCYANCDGNSTAPTLNVSDFTCFLQKFAAGDPYANCDGSTTVPQLNVTDFTCFLQKFAGGCS